MKPWKKWTAVSVIAFSLVMPGFAHAEDMMMKTFNYTGVETVMKDGKDLAPLRQVAESLGYKVTWNDMDSSIALSKLPKMDDKKMDTSYSVTIKIASKTIMVGTTEKMLDYAPTIIKDKTYVTKEFVDMYLLNDMMMK
jgi:hypothetical protein